MQPSIGVNRPLVTCKRIDVRIRVPVIIDVTVRIRLIMWLHIGAAIAAVITASVVVPLRVGRDH